MDDVVNRFARELADAIAAAVAESPEVEACRERDPAKAGQAMRARQYGQLRLPEGSAGQRLPAFPAWCQISRACLSLLWQIIDFVAFYRIPESIFQ